MREERVQLFSVQVSQVSLTAALSSPTKDRVPTLQQRKLRPREGTGFTHSCHSEASWRQVSHLSRLIFWLPSNQYFLNTWLTFRDEAGCCSGEAGEGADGPNALPLTCPLSLDGGLAAICYSVCTASHSYPKQVLQ